jgi:serine protease Do
MRRTSRLERAGRASRLLVPVLAALVGAGTAAGQNAADSYTRALDLQRAFAEIYRQAEPAVVTVFPETEKASLAEQIRLGKERVPQGLGSGFIIDKRGYLITNEHVVREGQKFSVQLSDGTTYDGKLVGQDQLLDIALVKIVVPEAESGKTFPIVRLGDSDAVRPGMWTITMGNPVGIYFDDSEPVISVGIVSGINRTFVSTLADRRQGLRTYGGLIQTDAVINPGNSGGPLLNIRGEVIGVNTLLWSPTGYNIGLGFAVPINTIRRKIRLLGEGYGVRPDKPMQYGTIDAEVETLTEFYADVLHLKGRRGVYVKHVIEGGAAAKAGMQDKDVILAVAGRRVVNAAQFVTLVAHLPIGEAVPFETWRVVEDVPKTMVLNVVLSGKTIQEIEAGIPPSSE